MYEDLVKSLRVCGDALEKAAFADYETCLYKQAADAIERLMHRESDLEKLCEAWQKLYDGERRWIPVTERLPVGGDDSGAVCENVCLMMDDGTVSCGWMNGITKKVYYLNARDDFVIKAPITRVTHWMPLPTPPKEET